MKQRERVIKRVIEGGSPADLEWSKLEHALCDAEPVGRPLENELGGKLHDSGVRNRSRDFAEGSGLALVASRIGEMRRVGQVKEFKSGLESVPFHHRKILEHREIAVDKSRSSHDDCVPRCQSGIPLNPHC